MPDNTTLCPLSEDICYESECQFWIEENCAICWIAISLAKILQKKI